ncbi:amino acid adenylation domain-containing protein [Actinacidiphila paucisporea]|nr:amino acid adenylation domain-containing protein [Actinacidiphila paucisporea]
MPGEPLSAVMAGEQALLAECAAAWLARGHRLSLLVSPDPDLRAWARARGVPTVASLRPGEVETALNGEPFDYLFSITNMRIVPRRLLDLPRRLPINFHDALLPRHAGVHATSWALLESPAEHGVTWHVMTAGADEGDILLRRRFPVGPEDTAYDLNTACFQAGMDSFAELADLLAAGRAVAEPQDLLLRTYHGRGDVLPDGGLLRWTRRGRQLHALVRATGLGRGDNGFGTAKLLVPDGYVVVGAARLLPPPSAPSAPCAPSAPGTLLAADAAGLTVATADGALTVSGLRHPDGTPAAVADLLARSDLRPGDRLPLPDPADVAALVARMTSTRPYESRWARRLAGVSPYELPWAHPHGPARPAGGWTSPSDEASSIRPGPPAGDGLRAPFPAPPQGAPRGREELPDQPSTGCGSSPSGGGSSVRSGPPVGGGSRAQFPAPFPGAPRGREELRDQPSTGCGSSPSGGGSSVRSGPPVGGGSRAPGMGWVVAAPQGLGGVGRVEPQVAALAAVLLFLARTADEPNVDVSFRPAAPPGDFFAATVPLRLPVPAAGLTFAGYCAEVAAATAEVEAGSYLTDLAARYPAAAPGSGGLPVEVGVGGEGEPATGAVARVLVGPGGYRVLPAADRVEPEAAAALVADFGAFLAALCDAPGDVAEVPLLSGARRAQVVEGWNATATGPGPGPAACVPALFAEQASRRPAAVAVIAERETLTYAQLDVRAQRLAAAMTAAGVGRGDLVGVYLDRSGDLVAALLGVMKAGAAYVPLDPVYPPDRVRAMVEDAGVRLLLTGGELPLPGAVRSLGIEELDVAEAVDADPAGLPVAPPGPEDLAYVIYTSGSTGRPKGVRITHRALANFLRAMAAEPGCTADDRLLAVTTVCFDIAGLELFLPLVTGGCVELVPQEAAADGFALRARLERSRPTLMQATPATWRLLVAAGWEGDPALRALCGGEALPADLAGELLGRVRALWNLYGPTETTVWSAAGQVLPGDRVTLGRPIANTRCYVMDRRGRPLPPYVAGELYIGGAGVADGYHGRPDLTAEKFVPDGLGGTGRLYRTGDLVRWLADGRLDCLGRIDDQVKIDGFRIELGEVEAVLQRHGGVRRAVVAAREDAAGTRRLVAYVVPAAAGDSAAPESPSPADLRRHLARDLPAYMIPAVFVPLAEVPLTRNGKVDRRALPPPPRDLPLPSTVRPRPGPEEAVASVWRAVLGRDDIGVDDNFFDAGGNSLLLVEAVKRLNAALALRLTSVDMFRHPTVRTMAASLAPRTTASPPAHPGAPRIDRSLLHRRRRG